MSATAADVAQPLMDVPAVATILGASPDWVTDHALELGGIFLARKWKWTPTGLAEALSAMRARQAREAETTSNVFDLPPGSIPSAGRRRRATGT